VATLSLLRRGSAVSWPRAGAHNPGGGQAGTVWLCRHHRWAGIGGHVAIGQGATWGCVIVVVVMRGLGSHIVTAQELEAQVVVTWGHWFCASNGGGEGQREGLTSVRHGSL